MNTKGELHTQRCPVCGCRDEETKVKDGMVGVGDELRGVYYCGIEEFGVCHEWVCMECGHNWATLSGFMRDEVAA